MMHNSKYEIKDPKKILEIISSCKVIRLALSDTNAPYIVPLNFGYEFQENQLYFYMHGASEGKKVDLIRNKPVVGFEMDSRHSLVTADLACSHTYYYASIIGYGQAELLSDPADKRHGLDKIMDNISPDSPKNYNDKTVTATSVFRITVHEYSVKSNIPAK